MLNSACLLLASTVTVIVISSPAMIVKGLDRTTDEKLVRRSFEYITQFPIVDIRLVRDKYGMSRGFCFVQWKTVEVRYCVVSALCSRALFLLLSYVLPEVD